MHCAIRILCISLFGRTLKARAAHIFDFLTAISQNMHAYFVLGKIRKVFRRFCGDCWEPFLRRSSGPVWEVFFVCSGVCF